MENVIEFFIPLKEPPTITQQEHKIAVIKGKPVFYDPPELKTVKNLFLGYLVTHRPEDPFHGPVRLTTKWIWPCRNKHEVGEYKATKPDTDNLLKAFKDCMTSSLYWKDDSQVASEITEKFYGDHPGIYVRVEEL